LKKAKLATNLPKLHTKSNWLKRPKKAKLHLAFFQNEKKNRVEKSTAEV